MLHEVFKCIIFAPNEHLNTIVMNATFANRLISARKQAGFSQDELVTRIGEMVKKTAIAKYERGEMMPKPKVIEALAGALAQPIDYFFKKIEINEINQVHNCSSISVFSNYQNCLSLSTPSHGRIATILILKNLFFKLLKHHTRNMSAKTKCIAHCISHIF